jgi:osmoprotectant transport system substrate-binding protein
MYATVARFCIRQRRLACAVGLALALACAACTTSGGRSPPASAPAGDASRAVITVGSFDFPESVLLAYLYADALSARGYPVRVLPDLGSRELVDPALMAGLIQVVPEYTGSALEFVSLGRAQATARVMATARALASWMAARGVITAQPAAAQDGNAIVVTGATAARYRLRRVSDLAGVAPGLVFGGPPECPERPYCLLGLR